MQHVVFVLSGVKGGQRPSPQGFPGHLIAGEFSQEECRDGEESEGLSLDAAALGRSESAGTILHQTRRLRLGKISCVFGNVR